MGSLLMKGGHLLMKDGHLMADNNGCACCNPTCPKCCGIPTSLTAIISSITIGSGCSQGTPDGSGFCEAMRVDSNTVSVNGTYTGITFGGTPCNTVFTLNTTSTITGAINQNFGCPCPTTTGGTMTGNLNLSITTSSDCSKIAIQITLGFWYLFYYCGPWSSTSSFPQTFTDPYPYGELDAPNLTGGTTTNIRHAGSGGSITINGC